MTGGDSSPHRWVALVYHNVEQEAAATGGGPGRFSVPARMFERMLDVIRDGGFRGCSLAAARRMEGGRRVAITFDDAESGVFHHALPALRARQMTATVYVVTDWVGRPGFMTWDELRRVVDWGMSVQSHSRSHPFLSELDTDGLRAELAGSKDVLDRELRQDTTELAFPGGDPPRRPLRSLIAACGYQVAVGSRWGTNPDAPASGRFVRRCTVRGTISPAEADALIRADRWLALRRQPREAALRAIRTALGPSRYARWRRRLLDAVAGPR